MSFAIKASTVQDLIDELSQVVDKTKNVWLHLGDHTPAPLRLVVDDMQSINDKKCQILILADWDYAEERTDKQEKKMRKILKAHRKMEKQWQLEAAQEQGE